MFRLAYMLRLFLVPHVTANLLSYLLFNRYQMSTPATIDNLAAERAIRPLTVQRKNSLFFCSTKGALSSAVYNTFIETCKQVGISFRDYFRVALKALGSGREDYENLLLMTIGIKSNN